MARFLELLIVAATAALGIRLYSTGLNRRYRAFFYFLVFSTLQYGALMAPNPRSGLYQQIYVLTEPIGWVLYAWVVLELYSLVLEDYQGLYTVGRWALILAVSLAVVASAASLFAPSRYMQSSRLMSYYYVAERAIYFSLVVFLLSILLLLMQYPITLSRNISLHSVVYSIYFLSNTVIYVLLSMRGFGMIVVVRYLTLAVTLASLATWLLLLSPVGETRKLRLRPAWMPGREEELVNQLNSLNAALLRATRK